MKRSHVQHAETIRRLLTEGWSGARIVRELGIAKSTVSYHAGRLGRIRTPKPKYDYAKIQQDIDNGLTVRQIKAKHGCCSATYSNAVKREALVPRPTKAKMDLDQLAASLNGGRARSYDRKLMRRFLVQHYGAWACTECGLINWRGKPITLEVDHLDGNPRNNGIENLRLLCPNCHSVTDTWRGRNIGK